MTPRIWGMRWRLAFARRRLLAWNVGVPVLLIAPVALSGAAAPHRTAVFSMFFLMFASFGSAIPLVRDAGAGWVEKLHLTGYGDRRWLAERAGAESVLDVCELLPAVAVILWASDAPLHSAAALIAALWLAVAAGQVLGVVVACAVRSLAEAALTCAVAALLTLHLAGIFRPAPAGGLASRLEWWSPLRPLRDVLAALGSGVPAGPASSWGPPLVALVAVAGVMLLLAPPLVRRLGGSRWEG